MVWLSHSQQLLFQYILEIASWDIVTLLNNLIPYSKPNMKGFPRWLSDKESACQSRRLMNSGSIPGLGRYPGKGNGNPLQHSCLGNPMDRGAWQSTVHGVAKSWTWLSNWAHTYKPSKKQRWRLQIQCHYLIRQLIFLCLSAKQG